MKGMYEKALRALDPSKGRNYKDQVRREKKRQRILQHMLKGDAIPTECTYPGLHERWGRAKEEQVAFHDSVANLRHVVEKVVKGISFIEDGWLIDAEMELNIT